jgi:hypothetical protein
MADPLRFVEVATMDEQRDELVVLRIPPDGVPAARERGWMVFEDFEALAVTFNPPRLASPQGDGDSGEDAA